MVFVYLSLIAFNWPILRRNHYYWQSKHYNGVKKYNKWLTWCVLCLL